MLLHFNIAIYTTLSLLFPLLLFLLFARLTTFYRMTGVLGRCGDNYDKQYYEEVCRVNVGGAELGLIQVFKPNL